MTRVRELEITCFFDVYMINQIIGFNQQLKLINIRFEFGSHNKYSQEYVTLNMDEHRDLREVKLSQLHTYGGLIISGQAKYNKSFKKLTVDCEI